MTLTIAPDMFSTDDEFYDNGWEADPRFEIQTDDVEPAAEGLEAARARLGLVGISGREYQAEDLPVDEYTPNFIGEVRIGPRGPLLYMDTKGYLSEAMATTMLNILIEELSSRGVEGVIDYDYDFAWLSSPPWTLSHGH